MGTNDDLDGKTTNFYWFLHTNDKGTKMFKTSHSERWAKPLGNQNFITDTFTISPNYF